MAEDLTIEFTVGHAGWERDEGWCYTSGEIRLANGKRFWAILTVCEMDSGEFYGALVPHKDEVRDQQDGFVGFLAGTENAIFPYKYRYDAVIALDHHVGADGWSR